MNDGRVTAEEIFENIKARVEVGLLTSIVTVATFVDATSGEEDVYIWRDSQSAVWTHLGMLRVATLDVESMVENTGHSE